MASITIRNLDDGIKQNLRIRAAENSRSMEEEVREILRRTLGGDPLPDKNLGTAIHQLFKDAGGIELDIPPRQPMRELPDFD
ncbi:MAG: plasmid stabilization protein [Gammaproteobacteria bacterium]|nr:plasmid stabilization protein [Gammaproteobacteria bacterium]